VELIQLRNWIFNERKRKVRALSRITAEWGKKTCCSLTNLSFSLRKTRGRDREADHRELRPRSRLVRITNHLRDRGKEIVLLSRRAAPLRVWVFFANLASSVTLSLSDSQVTSLQAWYRHSKDDAITRSFRRFDTRIVDFTKARKLRACGRSCDSFFSLFLSIRHRWRVSPVLKHPRAHHSVPNDLSAPIGALSLSPSLFLACVIVGRYTLNYRQLASATLLAFERSSGRRAENCKLLHLPLPHPLPISSALREA